MAIRILITGSRTWTDIDYIRQVFTSINDTLAEEITLVSGHCPKGADMLGEKIALELGWNVELHPADWNQHGRKAGFVRNQMMVDSQPYQLVAFVHNKSKGAAMTVQIAKKASLPIIVHSLTDYPVTRYDVKEYNQLAVVKNDNDKLF